MIKKEENSFLYGFRAALCDLPSDTSHIPLFDISSLLLGKNVPSLSPEGKRWPAFMAEMERFAVENFIPVIEIPADSTHTDTFNSVISLLENIVIRQTGMQINVANGMKYMIDECSDNIIEHSRSEYGYFSSRFNQDAGYVDICLADRGVTVLGSYRAINDEDIKSDLEALQAANRGISTKNRPDAENRGYGLMTTKKMLITGLSGEFVMISGGSVFVYESKGKRFIDSGSSLKVHGTIVAMRMPICNEGFNYIKYIE